MYGTNPAHDEYHSVGTNRQPLDPHLLKVVPSRFAKTADACTSAAAARATAGKLGSPPSCRATPLGAAGRAWCWHEIGLLYRLASCGP
jgi:hypothetical protein